MTTTEQTTEQQLDLTKVENLEARQKLKAVLDEFDPIEAEEDAAIEPLRAKQSEIEAAIAEAEKPFEARKLVVSEKVAAMEEELGVSVQTNWDNEFDVCVRSGLPILEGDDTREDEEGNPFLACFADEDDEEEEAAA